MHALVASPYKSAYNAAKHGVAGFTKVRAECLMQTLVWNAWLHGDAQGDGQGG